MVDLVSEVGKVPDEPGASECARKQGGDQGMMGPCQKDRSQHQNFLTAQV